MMVGYGMVRLLDGDNTVTETKYYYDNEANSYYGEDDGTWMLVADFSNISDRLEPGKGYDAVPADNAVYAVTDIHGGSHPSAPGQGPIHRHRRTSLLQGYEPITSESKLQKQPFGIANRYFQGGCFYKTGNKTMPCPAAAMRFLCNISILFSVFRFSHIAIYYYICTFVIFAKLWMM